VPSFAGVAAFVQGGPWLATMPALLHRHALRGLAMAPLPLPCPAMPMYLVWHVRHQVDPLNRWLREQLEAVVAQVLRQLSPTVPRRHAAGSRAGCSRCGA
jgi:DNA-binding transcriptional LysR family regulator